MRRLEYKMPVWACASWGAFLLYYLFWLVLAATSGQWLILVFAAVLGGFAWFGLYYFEYLQQWRNEQHFKRLEPTKQQHLQAQRQHLLPFIQNK